MNAKKLDGSGMGKVDVDDFSNYMAEMEDGAACTFRITRFGYGRGNYQTMEIYGSEGAIQYELDHVAPDTDEFPSALAVPTQRLMCSQNFPSRKSIRWTRCSLLPTLSTARATVWQPISLTVRSTSMLWTLCFSPAKQAFGST